MHIVSVLLIGGVAPHKQFSYWSAVEMPDGGIVAIGSSDSKQYGLIMSCEPLEDLKQSVRNADFSLKKVRGGGRIFTREFLRAVFDIARWNACGAGAVLHAMTPQWALVDAVAGKENLSDTFAGEKRAIGVSAIKIEKENIIGTRESRFAHMSRIAREEFTKQKTCLILAPTIIEVARLGSYLQNEFSAENDCEIIILHGGLTTIRARNAWRKIASSKKPLIVVGTPIAISCPLKNIGAIMLERAGAYGYNRTEQRPFLNLGECARLYAESIGAKFISLSPAPLVCESSPHHLPKERLNGNCKVIDMRPPPQSPDAPIKKHRFQLFATETIATISATLADEKNVLLICARRGLATSTICDDCGSTVLCKKCYVPLILHEAGVNANTARFFQCPRCGVESSTRILCATCSGWRLKMLGVGTEGVAKEAHAQFPEKKIMTLEEKTANSRSVAKMAQDFTCSRGALLVATDGILQHIDAQVEQIIIVSVDSFLCVPEFSASEQASQLLTSCRDLSHSPLIVQTRLPEHPAIVATQNNNWDIFMRQEHNARKQLSYPPYSTLVRISLEGALEKTHIARDNYMKILAQNNPQTFSGHVAQSPRAKSTRVREHILLRIPIQQWPDQKLINFLRLLPQSVEICINPKSVFMD